MLDREPGIEVVGEAENGDQAVHAVDRLRPDVILMDLEMPGTGGIEATRQITAQHTDMRIVVLTSHAAVPALLHLPSRCRSRYGAAMRALIRLGGHGDRSAAVRGR